jgi:hypothetical protein
VKRGLIAWNPAEIPPAVFAHRIDAVRQVMQAQDLPALVVYAELWRSNQARFYANFMPYFNRALLIIPVQESPTLLCGLSPRVYKWIQSVTSIEDIRPGKNFADPLTQLAAERNWKKIGMLDAAQLPWDMYQAIQGMKLDVVDIASTGIFRPATDRTELNMRSKAVAITAGVLAGAMPTAIGALDHHFVGRLEGALRRAGAEDLIIMLSNGEAPPALPSGAVLRDGFSVSVAMEYRGHWIRLSRPQVDGQLYQTIRDDFDSLLADLPQASAAGVLLEDLAGSYPYKTRPGYLPGPGSLFAMHMEYQHKGSRLFYGDTCWINEQGAQIL